MTNGGLLTAEQILAADDLKTDYVECAEWGGTIKVRAMGSAELAEWRNRALGAARAKMGDLGNLSEADIEITLGRSDYWIVGKCAIDEKGNPLFTEEQIEKLAAKSDAPIARAGKRIRELSGLTEEAAQEIAGKSEAEAQPATI